MRLKCKTFLKTIIAPQNAVLKDPIRTSPLGAGLFSFPNFIHLRRVLKWVPQRGSTLLLLLSMKNDLAVMTGETSSNANGFIEKLLAPTS